MLEALFPSQASPVLFGVLCVLYALLMFGLFREIKTFVSYKREESFAALLSPRLSKFYFYGYSLEEIYRQQFFTRYRKFVDHGFCYAVAAINMIALHDIPSCRLVYGTEQENSEIYEHACIEFYHRRTWWVMDPLWLSPGLVMSRRTYYRGHEHKNLHVYTHDDFWSYAVTHQLKEKLQHPETSFLLFEIWDCSAYMLENPSPFTRSLLRKLSSMVKILENTLILMLSSVFRSMYSLRNLSCMIL